MVTLKCIKPIKDSSVNRLRVTNEVFTVTPERAIEMQNGLGATFKNYFVVQKVAKVEKKETVKKEAPSKQKATKKKE